MKRVTLVAALIALGTMATSVFADVQNIRLSGDIRMRGYYLANTSIVDALADDGSSSDTFITQRTRVTVEADLEDHVLAVVTLRAEGMWGSYNESIESSAGAGIIPLGLVRVNRGWDVGINEAYLQLNQVFFTPATLKVGRQYLNYGRGLILSSFEQEYNFDAARLVLDYYPLTIDLVYAKAFEGSVAGLGGSASISQLLGLIGGPISGGAAHDADMFFVNARYEMADSLIKNVEAYFGYMMNNVNFGAIGTIPLDTIPWAPPTILGASPMIIGARADMNITKSLQTWVEGAYEFGTAGPLSSDDIQAFLLNAGARLSFADVQMTPVLNASYTWASGGGEDGKNYFRPWFDNVEGYNGYVFHPMLSNIHIFNVGASIKPAKNCSLAVQGYYYMKADADGIAFPNPNVDVGLIPAISANDSRDLGFEIDAILGYDYSKDVRCQLIYGVFIPQNGVKDNDLGFIEWNTYRAAHGVRAEVNVKF